MIVLAALLVLAPAPSNPEATGGRDEAAAEDPATRAARLFSEDRFAEAAAAFGVAYDATGDAAMLFGRAQALRRAGNCSAAVGVFEQFIETSPPAADVDEARRLIDECREVLSIDDEPPPPVVTGPPAGEPGAGGELRDVAPPRPWYKDPPGGVMVGVGLAVTAVGAGLYGGSFAAARDGAGESEAQFENRATRVRALAGSGVALLVTGGALLVGSIVRYALVARRNRRNQ